jgi:hypothetical protein
MQDINSAGSAILLRRPTRHREACVSVTLQDKDASEACYVSLNGPSCAQEPLMKVATVCRDEGAGEACMRGTVATKAIKVHVCSAIQSIRM